MPEFPYRWHYAINDFHHSVPLPAWASWMYEAKTAASEIVRLPLLFKMERENELPPVHRQCSHSASEPVPDNHLTCCLGVKCRECPHLLALDSMEGTLEERDTAKAWTCVTHIISKGGDPAKEGYILTTDDRMYWDRLHENLATDNPDADRET